MDTATAFELADTDAIGLGALAATGELSATELLEAAIIRLDAGRELNTVITDLFDYGRARAEALDASGVLRSGDSGPLAGVPFLIKDIGASLAGTPEAMGSRALRTHVAQHTAWIVERYLEAGLVLFGKTNTPEWANHCTTEPSLFGATGNPWGLDITPGGSSGVTSGCGGHDTGGVLRPCRTQAAEGAYLLGARGRSHPGGSFQRARADADRSRQRGVARRRHRSGRR